MTHLGQLKHCELGHDQFVVYLNFQDETARNNVFRVGLPYWYQIAQPQLVLGDGDVKPCLLIVMLFILYSLRYYLEADTFYIFWMYHL